MRCNRLGLRHFVCGSTICNVGDMHRTDRKILAVFAVLVVLLAGCGSSSTTGDTISRPASGVLSSGGETGLADLADVERTVAEATLDVLSAPSEAWPGFDDYPTVIVLVDDDDAVSGAFALNHPSPDALGEARLVTGVEVDSLYFVAEPLGLTMPANTLFDFDVEIGGVPTYVVVSRSETGTPLQLGSLNLTELVNHGSPAWKSVALHELFHLFQGREWNERFADQGSYTFTVDNFELAMLEDQALVAAYNSSGDESIAAIRHFVALRELRLELFPSTDLDERQEVTEGTAQWIEWKTTRSDEKPWVDPVLGDLSDTQGFVNNILALGQGLNAAGPDTSRWYLSGATLAELLERNGVDWQSEVSQGATQSELLRAEFPVDAADRDQLLLDAIEAYDPDGRFEAIAAQWVDAALAQGGVMTGDDGAVGDDAGIETEEIVIAEDDFTACLAEFGYDIEALMESGGEIELSDEAFEACG